MADLEIPVRLRHEMHPVFTPRTTLTVSPSSFLHSTNNLCQVKKRAPLPWVVQAVRSSAHHSYIWFRLLFTSSETSAFRRRGWLIRGWSDRLEDLMNVADENEGEF